MKKVFIAEDNQSIARMYRRAFQKSGWEVETASDGEEALGKLFASKDVPDAILLDIMMPKADGFEVLKKIKKSGSALENVPVLAMTNLASLSNGEADLEKVRALGAKDVIIKSQLDPQEVVNIAAKL
ncbi:hypothetical protein A2926_04265 [Candidatus Giovannonibacteria bacterium RIFCSPLOWO2_01_FULL_44_40]|uniref:Response regulatory domain-containing protein n=1 Tax=Candidatus Giovannonibacteria bacterium RIFCSPHIGHO2_01_FULL_45_23 TaxID=1798325 RepID=A0A1F5VFT1_9BACT|nr:MAG: hypothetical protein A2834_02750 [Candidatus Giovannonibacteria bacterium RIFCSPHIGHO2_01_FULL_45_23]OGF75664.1 MAG: hypothetical protein A3C77_00045 [Candidatus Giovannonibacteria bacterium RIFCSPHIGHO2_02_FULL_45_13]OGF79904.1 MAG: hypothetical protein A2926_04265 [Candidatus Giovannonibacteria bacterium RIFCSPLOWO2_01_FULL_44_40]